MSDQIKAGDVVKLKSGSPAMTVDAVIDDWGVPAVVCSWFDGKSIQQSKFPSSSVVKTS